MLVKLGLMSGNMLSGRHKRRQIEGLDVKYENKSPAQCDVLDRPINSL